MIFYYSAEFQTLWGYSELEANGVTSIPYILAAFVCPIGGLFVDKLGRHALWVLGSTFAMSYAHSLLVVAPEGAVFSPVIAMVIIGLSYTICAASLWPSVYWLLTYIALVVRTTRRSISYMPSIFYV